MTNGTIDLGAIVSNWQALSRVILSNTFEHTVTFTLSEMSCFEILRGLRKKGAAEQEQRFKEFCDPGELSGGLRLYKLLEQLSRALDVELVNVFQRK